MHQGPWKQVFGCDTGRWSKEPEYRSLVTVNLATGKYTMESDLKRLTNYQLKSCQNSAWWCQRNIGRSKEKILDTKGKTASKTFDNALCHL